MHALAGPACINVRGREHSYIQCLSMLLHIREEYGDRSDFTLQARFALRHLRQPYPAMMRLFDSKSSIQDLLHGSYLLDIFIPMHDAPGDVDIEAATTR